MMMSLQSRLLTFFDVRRHESRLVLLVLLYTILLYAGNLLTYTGAYSLFLTTYDVTALPAVYIGVSIVASLLALLYLQLNKRFTLVPLLVGNLLFLALTLLGYGVGVRLPAPPWLIFTLPVYYGVVNTITITTFWNLVGRLFTLEQSKRLFGLLTTGEHLATISMGFLTPFLVQWTGAGNLLFVAAALITGALVVLGYLMQGYQLLLQSAERPREPLTNNQHSTPSQGALRATDPYLLLVYSLFMLYILGLYFVNNIFYGQVESHYPNAEQLAAFLSLLYGVVGVGSLLLQALIAGRLTQRFGAQRLLLLLPGCLLIIMGLFAVIGTATDLTRPLFWLAVLASGACTLLDAITWSAVNLLYHPLPPGQRTRIQTTVTGIVYPLGIGAAGLLLFYLTKQLQWTAVQLAAGLLLIVAGWLCLTLWLARAYPPKMRQILAARTAGMFKGIPKPLPHLAGFEQASLPASAGEVSDLLDLWEEVAPDQVADLLRRLIAHALPAVRLDVYQRIERLRLSPLLPVIRQQLAGEASPAVQAAGLRILATHGESQLHDEAVLFTQSPLLLDFSFR